MKPVGGRKNSGAVRLVVGKPGFHRHEALSLPTFVFEIQAFYFTAANGEDSTKATRRKTAKDLAEQNHAIQSGTGFTT